MCVFVSRRRLFLDKENKCLVVGHDLCTSSPAIAKLCITAAKSLGVDCVYVGAVPIPALAPARRARFRRSVCVLA